MVAEAETAAATDTSDVIEVLACNWVAVAVFQACQLTRLVGMTKVVCTGIAALEIVAALQLCGVPQQDWHEVGDGARLMGLAAAKAINEAGAR